VFTAFGDSVFLLSPPFDNAPWRRRFHVVFFSPFSGTLFPAALRPAWSPFRKCRNFWGRYFIPRAVDDHLSPSHAPPPSSDDSPVHAPSRALLSTAGAALENCRFRGLSSSQKFFSLAQVLLLLLCFRNFSILCFRTTPPLLPLGHGRPPLVVLPILSLPPFVFLHLNWSPDMLFSKDVVSDTDIPRLRNCLLFSDIRMIPFPYQGGIDSYKTRLPATFSPLFPTTGFLPFSPGRPPLIGALPMSCSSIFFPPLIIFDVPDLWPSLLVSAPTSFDNAGQRLFPINLLPSPPSGAALEHMAFPCSAVSGL